MPSDGAFRFGPYRLDPRGRRLFRHGVPIDLKAQQFDLLHALRTPHATTRWNCTSHSSTVAQRSAA